MIARRERIHLKKHLGSEYTQDVLNILIKKKIKNKFNRDHSAEYISLVLSGIKQNKDIEAALYDLAETRKTEKEAEQRKRDEILGIKKPDALTTGI